MERCKYKGGLAYVVVSILCHVFLLIQTANHLPNLLSLWGLCYAQVSYEDYLFDDDTFSAETIYDDVFLPIAINTATVEELRTLGILSEKALLAIVTARSKRPIKNEEELRRMGVDEDIVSKVASLISFDTDYSYRQRIRYQHKITDDKKANGYYQLFDLRVRDFRVGYITASDTLSNFFTDANSYYLLYQSGNILEQLIVGKYRVALGQGISHAPSLRISKSSASVTHPVKNFTPLKPHTSPHQAGSLEGIAAVFRLKQMALTPFYSQTKLHARLEDDKIRTIYDYGEHKKKHKNSVSETVVGLSLNYQYDSSNLGGYLTHSEYDRKFYLPAKSNKYNATGLYFNHQFEDIRFFGEYAYIDSKSGLLTGMRWGRSPLRQLLLFRHYEKGLPTRHGNPFSASSNFDNETGLYYGVELKPIKNATVNLFFDAWQYPGTSYFEKMPVRRSEQFMRIDYTASHNKKNRLRLTIRRKEYDKYRVIEEEGSIRKEQNLTCNVDWALPIEKSLILKTGAQFIDRYIPETNDYKQGFLVFENVSWKKGRLHLVGQINVFDSQISHYLYEYSLPGMWENRALSGDDVYMWLLVSAEVTKNITIEGKALHFITSKKTAFFSQVSCHFGK